MTLYRTAVAVFSRNNYQMLDGFFIDKVFDLLPDAVIRINIDDFSDPEDVELGKEICKKNGIVFLQNKVRGLQHSIQAAVDYLQGHNIDRLFVFQTDCYLYEGCLDDALNELQDDWYDQFGMIGFNISAEDCGCNPVQTGVDLAYGKRELYCVGRCPTAYRPYISWYRPSDLNMKDWPKEKVFAVEIPAWFCVVLNIKQWNKFITPTDQYHMILAWDDVALQFLKNNVYNACIPWIYGAHVPKVKSQFGMINQSVAAWKAGKEGNAAGARIIGTADHEEVFKSRWGWRYIDKAGYARVRNKYNGTLMNEFHTHDLTTGPLKVFEK